MTYATVCSGIEACSVAWEPLGWEPVFFSEIEKYQSAVLAHHYPQTPDSPRYQALGNSMAVPVMRWIGERIQKVDKILQNAQ